jgi:hypothetical protein
LVKVVTALRRELRDLGQSESTLGAGALALARRLDDPETVSSSVPAYQRELRETLAQLRADAAPQDVDRMSEFEQRQRARDERQAVGQ